MPTPACLATAAIGASGSARKTARAEVEDALVVAGRLGPAAVEAGTVEPCSLTLLRLSERIVPFK